MKNIKEGIRKNPNRTKVTPEQNGCSAARKIFYIISGIIVLAGIIIFIVWGWHSLPGKGDGPSPENNGLTQPGQIADPPGSSNTPLTVTDNEGMLKQVFLYEKGGDLERARLGYLQLLRQHGNVPGNYYEYAGYWMRRGIADSAFTTLDEAIQKFPGEALLYARKADIYGNLLKQLKPATELMEKATILDPGNYKLFLLLAGLYYDQKMFPLALTNILKANQLKPDDPEIISKIGAAYMAVGQEAKALEYLHKLPGQQPGK